MSAPEPELSSTKPYLIRAIYEWILDNGLTPHLLVDARYPGAQVPMDLAQDGQIVLNISPGAVRNLSLGNDWICFGARFSGMARELSVPTDAVLGIFSRENRQGMVFPQPEYPAEGPRDEPPPGPSGPTPSRAPTDPKPKGAPRLKVVK